MEALKSYGLLKGGRLAADRILRCHPWGTSGFDPVPRFMARKLKIKDYLPSGTKVSKSNYLKRKHYD